MIGEKIGHFTIVQKIGAGGMGAVYLAEHDIMQKKVAIKVLLPQWTQSAAIAKRFRNEAIAMAKLQHPNIVNVDDCGQLPDGTWYIIMEYLDGGSLSQFCKSFGPLTEHIVLQILCQVGAALEVAHKRNIVHRDLKPENIFLIAKKTNPHFVKVLDWGISKLGEHDSSGGITNAGMVAGTPAYMAPEQILDLRAVDRRTDVFALGAIAYRMLTGGWLPFQRGDTPQEFARLSLTAIRDLQMAESPTPLRHRLPNVNEGIEGAILAALHRDPAQRPQTARQFILMLAAAIPGDGYSPPGTDVVKAFAPELLEIGNLEETMRAAKPSEKHTTSRYRFGNQLGAGGMAEVFRATQVGAEGFSRHVAVKRVLPSFSSAPEFATMFIQEAKLASLLDHPNIVSVLDFDRDEKGHLFLAMEYVDGKDLATLANTGQLPLASIIFIISEVLSGLGHAHDLTVADGPSGLVHRDVSPHNVLVSWEGAVKVSDFGIAKARHAGASAATASMLVKGKPQYMSPEQANGEPLDGRSDLFAVGIMLWELLVGHHLFDGTTTQEAFAQVFFRTIPSPSTIVDGVPPDLDDVTMRLLARDKAERPTSAEEAIEDLAACADAPRNGRAELARLLAERFPDALPARRSRPPQRSSHPPHRPSQPPRRPSQPPNQPSQPPNHVTLSDRPPHESTPRQAQLPLVAPDAHTTLGGAASQSMSTSKGLRVAIPILVGIFIAVAALAGFGIYAATRRASLAPETTPRAMDAARAANTLPETALMITTDPAMALVRVDGIDHGPSPVTLHAPKGRQVTIDVRRDGYEPARQVVAMEHDTQAIALTLRPVPVVTPDAPPPIESAAPSHTKGSAERPPRRSSNRIPKDDDVKHQSPSTPKEDDALLSPETPKNDGTPAPFNPDDAIGD